MSSPPQVFGGVS